MQKRQKRRADKVGAGQHVGTSPKFGVVGGTSGVSPGF